MLIDNNDPVGLNFTGNVEGMDLNKLDYEDFRRHQGVRHPRTAVALTEHKKLLLITVDGRSTPGGRNVCKRTDPISTYLLLPPISLEPGWWRVHYHVDCLFRAASRRGREPSD